MNTHLPKLAYGIDEAVQATGLGRTRLYAAIKENRPHPRKYGRRTIILATELQSFLESLPEQEAA